MLSDLVSCIRRCWRAKHHKWPAGKRKLKLCLRSVAVVSRVKWSTYQAEEGVKGWGLQALGLQGLCTSLHSRRKASSAVLAVQAFIFLALPYSWALGKGSWRQASCRQQGWLVTKHRLVSVSPDCRVVSDVVLVNISPQALFSHSSLGTLQLLVLTEIHASMVCNLPGCFRSALLKDFMSFHCLLQIS